MLLGVIITTFAWLVTAYVSPVTDKKTLHSFLAQVNPDGPGWSKIRQEAEADGEPIQFKNTADSLPTGILCMVLGCVAVYSLLFCIGYWIYGRHGMSSGLGILSAISTFLLYNIWSKSLKKKLMK